MNDDLIDRTLLVEQIKQDVLDGDVTAIRELVRLMTEDNLCAFLDERAAARQMRVLGRAALGDRMAEAFKRRSRAADPLNDANGWSCYDGGNWTYETEEFHRMGRVMPVVGEINAADELRTFKENYMWGRDIAADITSQREAPGETKAKP